MARAFLAGLALSLLAGVATGAAPRGLHAGRASLLQAGSAGKSAAKRAGKSFVNGLEFKHRLRVCNAYPYSAPIDIFHGYEKITRQPLEYKTCHEFTPLVKEGDKLQFNIGDSNAGSFAVSELPNNDAALVLVIYRHDTKSTAVAFESHVFANLINAQVAVLDTYKGKAQSSPRIQDVRSAKTSRNEELRYDSVVAVNPGVYEVVLQDTTGSIAARGDLVALNRESYVIIRCGVEAEAGPLYPQELMVYPQSDPKALTGAASAAGWHFGVLAAALAASLTQALGAPSA